MQTDLTNSISRTFINSKKSSFSKIFTKSVNINGTTIIAGNLSILNDLTVNDMIISIYSGDTTIIMDSLEIDDLIVNDPIANLSTTDLSIGNLQLTNTLFTTTAISVTTNPIGNITPTFVIYKFGGIMQFIIKIQTSATFSGITFHIGTMDSDFPNERIFLGVTSEISNNSAPYGSISLQIQTDGTIHMTANISSKAAIYDFGKLYLKV
jgi:hypothetical protein